MLPKILQNLRIPVVGSPMFILSGPELVIAQCKAGIVGSFPALNAREKEGEPALLDLWLTQIQEELDRHNQENPDHPAAPFAVNQIVHRSNARLERDIEICHRHKVPIWITSLGAREDVNHAAHDCGGIVLHDIINNKFARKAIEKGADGLIAVAAGAGGHAGPESPFALVQEIRTWFDGPVLLSGAIATGRNVLAAQVIGADLAYIGSAFIAAQESRAQPSYKQMVVDSHAEDIVNSAYFTGVPGNYLMPSIMNSGMELSLLATGDPSKMDFATEASGEGKPKAWSQIWGCGQGIGVVNKVEPVAVIVDRLAHEYAEAKAAVARL